MLRVWWKVLLGAGSLYILVKDVAPRVVDWSKQVKVGTLSLEVVGGALFWVVAYGLIASLSAALSGGLDDVRKLFTGKEDDK